MTREEARHYLQSSGFSAEQIATIEQAFKQEPSSDLIRRTDLLDMVEDMTDQFGIKHRVITEGMISLLPSVNSQSCEDVISRQAVIDSLSDKFADGFDSDRWWNSMSVLYAINKVPSVKPQDCDTCEVGNPCLYCKHECKAQADGEYILKSEAIRVASGYCHPSNIAKELEKLPSVAIPSAEPREVLYSGDGYADGEMVYDMAECMNCGRAFEYGDETWGCKFCPDCGQALKWEGEVE